MQAIKTIEQVVIGKSEVVQKALLAIFAGGNMLFEDNPGVGKTTMALTIAKVLEMDYQRIQFTPEVMPADITGFSVLDRGTGRWTFQPGPVFCNLLLADEINRASAKSQSALLEAMEEHHVTSDGVTRALPNPFIVLATQNPVGSTGTQMLPESQMDRFMIRLSMGYPSPEDEIEILKRKEYKVEIPGPVIRQHELLHIQQEVGRVHVADDLYAYIVKIVNATRDMPEIRLGVSPRGTIALTQMARAVAWLNSRDFVIPGDVRVVAVDVLAHRILLTPSAKVSGATPASMVKEILRQVPPPKVYDKRNYAHG